MPPDRFFGGHRATFVRNHAGAIVACDFLTVVTASFRTLYVLVIMEIGTRRILHFNVTSNPIEQWTKQQFREAIPCDHRYRFLIHDRDSIFSSHVDDMINGLGLEVLRTPFRAPRANSFCERLVGTIRRSCLDFMIPLNERHLRRILNEWVAYYNHGRPHSSLGPGIPDPPEGLPVPLRSQRHELPDGHRVVSKAILGGLHHEYALEQVAA
jgi:transposase InsO family protein